MIYVKDFISIQIGLIEKQYQMKNFGFPSITFQGIISPISDEEFKKLLKENKILNDVHIVFFKDKEK